MAFPKSSSCNVFFILLLLLPLLSQSHMLTNSPSPVSFLQYLKGCHKGDNLKDISKLKHYLEKFGYLDYDTNPKSNHSINDNYFDHLLEEAVKTYQTNFHLNTTGALDSDTVATMMSPRCGVADIVNGTNRMQRHHHQPRGLHTVSHYSFITNPPRKWGASKTRLTYGFIPGTPQVAIDAVSKAYLTWSQNTQFKFARSDIGPDMTIGFYRGEHGDGHPFSRTGTDEVTIAHAFAPEDGRFHYNGDLSYTSGAVRPGAFDYETVALHEIGHLLGLGHSDIEGAIMYPKIQSGVTKGLHQDDIQGIRALYNV
ncbi:Metalloendoproteinase 5-MMP [Linum grandiflorum]